MSLKIKDFKGAKSIVVYVIVLNCLLLISMSFQVHKDQSANLKTTRASQINIDEGLIHSQEINELDFDKFIKMNDQALIYFYAHDCIFCEEFHQTFSLMQKVYSESKTGGLRRMSFGKLKLTEGCEKIFRELKIEAVPEIKYFSGGTVSNYGYVFKEYDRKSINKHLEWLSRVSMVHEFQEKMGRTDKLSIFGHRKELKQSYYIKQISNLQEVVKKLKEEQGRRAFIFNCTYEEREIENGELSRFLKTIFLENLGERFFCTNNQSLLLKEPSAHSQNSNQAFMNVYELAADFDLVEFKHKIILDDHQFINGHWESSLQSSTTVPQKDLHRVYLSNFMSYMNRQLEYWSQSSVVSVFTKNQSGFVLIMNNETNSKRLFQDYKQIKQKLNLQSQLPSLKFYHSDLSSTPQQTTRIKKHIFGIQISTKSSYPYPALAYLKPSAKYLQKYIFPLDLQLTPATMELWILKIIIQIQNVQNYFPSSQFLSSTHFSQKLVNQSITVKQHFRKTPEELFPTKYVNLFDQVYKNTSYNKQEKDLKLKIPEKFYTNKRQLKPINSKDFQILLSSVFKESFFVFVNSRNDFKSYQLYTQISQWIEGDQNEEENSEQDEEQHEPQPQEQDNHEKQGLQNQLQLKKSQEAKQKSGKIEIGISDKKQVQRTLQQIKKENPFHEQRKMEEQIYMEEVQRGKMEEHKKTQHQPIQIKQSSDKLTEEELFQVINFYLLNFNSNDYPPNYLDVDGKLNHIQIEFFPALLYFSKDKKIMKKMEGVQNIQQIQNFITNQLSKNHIVQGDTYDQQTLRESEGLDRELEGQIQTQT